MGIALSTGNLEAMAHARFTFIDLFAGIGGFHQALTAYGGKCVFASEWDKYAQEVYFQNYGLKPSGDITQIPNEAIPPHDILCAGFPCQAFSISGKQKGFDDIRGTLFFEIARIAAYHRPKVLFLENVKNLQRHNGGKTLGVIVSTLSDLGYVVSHQVLNSSHFGLPQNRERIYIVAIRSDIMLRDFRFPIGENRPVALVDILEDNPAQAKEIVRPDMRIYREVEPRENLFRTDWLGNNPIQIGIVNKGGQGERIYSPYGHAVTLSAYGGGVGAKTGLYLINGCVRRLSPRECARLQGFPEGFEIHPNHSQAYKQFGNSVSVLVLKQIVEEIIKCIIPSSKVLMMDKQRELGSLIAKRGFETEDLVVSKFNAWQEDVDAQQWLGIMGYDLAKVEYVCAVKLHGHKTDVQVQITIKLKEIIDVQNLQVKLVSRTKGFNQIDKRWVDRYAELWGIPLEVLRLLKLYTGEVKPDKTIKLRDRNKRRLFANEFSLKEQSLLLDWIRANQSLIVSDILKGRGQFSAEWMLVIQGRSQSIKWVLQPMNYCLNFFGNGDVVISPRGTIKIGKITMQRKGGDAGRETANMLQFKINPAELLGG